MVKRNLNTFSELIAIIDRAINKVDRVVLMSPCGAINRRRSANAGANTTRGQWSPSYKMIAIHHRHRPPLVRKHSGDFVSDLKENFIYKLTRDAYSAVALLNLYCRQLLSRCSQLTELSVDLNEGLHLETLEAISNHCRQLEVIHLYGVKDQGLCWNFCVLYKPISMGAVFKDGREPEMFFLLLLRIESWRIYVMNSGD